MDEHVDIIFSEPDDIELITIESTLTKEYLDRATEIVYGFDNGSVPEPWHYECSVCVSRGSVSVVFEEGYYNNGVGFYREESHILELEYEQFLMELTNLHKVRYNWGGVDIDSAPQYYLSVKKGKEELFSANLNDLDISQEKLETFFLALMSDSQKEIVGDESKIKKLLAEFNRPFTENHIPLDDEIVMIDFMENDNVDDELVYTSETDEDE